MKADVQLKDLKLLKQSRLSVLPVSEKQAERILELAKG
jgi:predicted RNA-binding protein with PUA-like domain